jgi:carbon-monoxide dehydrogenase large subunit
MVSELEGGDATLSATSDISTMLPTFPNGCHACEVEIDPETGGISIVSWAAVDDVGKIINPMLVDGQTHGAIVQGVGQALLEECIHDPETAQLLSGSFMDYALPRADMFPDFVLENNEIPAPNNPLGVKGAGEGGTTGAPPALINAIVDALAPYNVVDVRMPATPQRIWQAIHAGSNG